MGVVAVIILESSLLHGCHSHQFSSVITLGLLPLMHWRSLHWRLCRCMGFIALVTLALLLGCCPHCTCVFANIALGSLPLSCLLALMPLHGHHCQLCMGVIAIFAWMSPLSSYWRHPHCMGVIAINSLASLRWHCCPQRAGVFAVVALALSRDLQTGCIMSWPLISLMMLMSSNGNAGILLGHWLLSCLECCVVWLLV